MTQEQVSPPCYALEASALSVDLGGKRVLEIPSLTVFPGEVLVIIGPNGSGKTTLLLSLALLLGPASGSVSYRGQAVGDASQALRLRRRFAVVFQDPLLLSARVWENVTLGLRLRGFTKEETRARAEKWLERFGVESLAKRQARTLSGGEAKRVSLARAFALQPEILFLDEPFAALDSPTHQALMEDLGMVLRETKVTTVMVTHDRDEALALADRVAVLMNGRIRQIGSPREVFSSPVDKEVAGFVGVENALPAVVSSQSNGIASVAIGQQRLDVVSELPGGSKVVVCIPPEDITLSVPSAEVIWSSARNRLPGRILKVSPLGYQMRVTLDCGFPLVALITRRSWEDMGLQEGQTLVASFKASAIHLIRRSDHWPAEAIV